MKIFRLNDCDWWIGETLDACVADYRASVDDDPVQTEDAEEVSDASLDKLIFTDTDENEQPIAKRTFREQLAIEVAAGGRFPRLFASTEY